MSKQKITPCLWFDFRPRKRSAHYLEVAPRSGTDFGGC